MTAPNETWKPVPGYEMKYHVSDLGRVRSLPRWDGRRNMSGKVLSPGGSKSGHETVALGKGNSKTVHSLVLLAFIGPRPEGADILHGNHVHWDNRLCNIRYTPREVKEKGTICPKCGKPLTIGVENRVVDLSEKILEKKDLLFLERRRYLR